MIEDNADLATYPEPESAQLTAGLAAAELLGY
jgi:hypothetical protein